MNTRDEILQLRDILKPRHPQSAAVSHIFSAVAVWERGQSVTATAHELRRSVKVLAGQAPYASSPAEAYLLAAVCCLGHATAAYIMTREPLAVVLLTRAQSHVANAAAAVQS